MKEQIEKQAIEEMAKEMCHLSAECKTCQICDERYHGDGEPCYFQCVAKEIIKHDYRKQSVGEWEWFEEWTPSTSDHVRECYDCGWRCGKCKTALEDVVGGYWDDPDKKPNLNFCPDCGARMKGGEE